MSQIQDQIESAVRLLEKQKVPAEYVRYYEHLFPGLCRELIGAITANAKRLNQVAERNGDKEGDARKWVRFTFGVKIDFTNPSVVDADTKLVINDGVKQTGKVLEEMDQGQLGITEEDTEDQFEHTD